MSHHQSNFNQQQQDSFNEQFEKLINDRTQNSESLGKTDTFPNGKINELDEGGFKYSIGVDNGVLIINYGEPGVKWVGFTRSEVIDLIAYFQSKLPELK